MSGKGRPKTETTTQSVTFDPSVQDKFNQLWDIGIENEFQQWGGPFANDLTTDEQSVLDKMRGIAMDGSEGMGIVGEGTGVLRDVAQFQPDQVTSGTATFDPVNLGGMFSDFNPNVTAGRAGAGQANAGSIAGDAGTLNFRNRIRDLQARTGAQGMEQYMDPFRQQVTQQAIADADRARQISNQDAADMASSAGAFGGTRHALLEAENNRNFMDTVARTSGQLGSDAFRQAMAGGGSDADRFLQGQGQNQQADITAARDALGLSGQIGLGNADAQTRAAIANANNATQASIASKQNELAGMGMMSDLARFNSMTGADLSKFNVGSMLNADLANQGAGADAARIRMGAGQGMGQMGNLYDQMNLSNLGFFNNLGGVQRGINDMNLQGNYNEFLRGQNFDLNRMGMMGNMLASGPNNYTTTTTSPLYQPSPLQGGLGGALTGFGLGGPLGGLIGGGLGLFGGLFG